MSPFNEQTEGSNSKLIGNHLFGVGRTTLLSVIIVKLEVVKYLPGLLNGNLTVEGEALVAAFRSEHCVLYFMLSSNRFGMIMFNLTMTTVFNFYVE
jgi:hypothetical protein